MWQANPTVEPLQLGHLKEKPCLPALAYTHTYIYIHMHIYIYTCTHIYINIYIVVFALK